MQDRLARLWPVLAVLIALSMLATAHAFETFGRYPPCELCLKQRDIYWAIVWVGACLAITTRFKPAWLRAACGLLALLFLGECLLAAYHAGVEWKWWPGPTSCTSAGVHKVTVEDMSALLSGAQQHVVQCDVAAWRILGLSMAGWNAVAALVFSAGSFAAAARPSKG